MSNQFENSHSDHEDNPLAGEEIQALWNKLEPRLKNKKRRRSFLWLWSGLSGILMLSIFYLLWVKTDSQGVKSNAPDNLLEQINPTNTSKKIQNTASIATSSYVSNQNNQLSSSSDRKLNSNYAQNKIKEASKVVNNKQKVAYDGSNDHTSELQTTSNPLSKPNYLGQDYSKPNETLLISSGPTIEDKTLNQRSFDTTTSYPNRNNPKSIQNLSPLVTKPLNHQSNLAILAVPVMTNEWIKPIDKRWIVQFGLNWNHGYTVNRTLPSDYALALREVIKSNSGYGAETSVQYFIVKDKIAITTSARYDRYVEKMTLNNTITLEESFINPEAFVSNNTYISASQARVRTIHQDVLNYNSNHSLSMSVGVLYKPTFAHRWSIEGSINAHFYQKYNGKWMDQNLGLIPAANQEIPTLLKTFYPQLRLSVRPINRLPIHLNTSYALLPFNIQDLLNRSYRHQLYFGISYSL